MLILQVEHKVPNFDAWKKVFDRDPIKRKKSGVRRYRIFRPTDDPNYVVVDMEFDNLRDLEKTLTTLHTLWGQVEGKVMVGPKTRILEIVESIEY
jgi:hypothetical protein